MWVTRSLAFALCSLLMAGCGGKSMKTIGGEAGGGSQCEETLCEGDCVDTSSDRRNCGECGNACGPSASCIDGACRGSLCEPPTVLCGSECVDTRFSQAHCGACGFACGTDAVCSNGDCVFQCPFGQCGNVCVDFGSDPNNCGGCGYRCGPSQFCSGGTCFEQCAGEFLGYCGDVCVDLSSDHFNCGACGNACPLDGNWACVRGFCSANCTDGLFRCFDRCVDIYSDPQNCGGCGYVCPADAFCSGGLCSPVCPMGTLCGMECVDLRNNPNHCGNCNRPCMSGRCIGGQCAAPGCGNSALEPGEEGDPPPGPVAAVPLDFGTCRYDFSRINQWYCNGSCGTWGGGDNCDQGDADAFCRLKMDNPRATAVTFAIVNAFAEPGVCCPTIPAATLGCTSLGMLTSRGVSQTVSVHPRDLHSTHHDGKVITNLVCTDP